MDRSPMYDSDLRHHEALANNGLVTPLRRIPNSRSHSASGSLSLSHSSVHTPSLLSSPSAGSSVNGQGSPLRHELGLGRKPGGDASRAERVALSRRLSQLAQQLADGDGDDVDVDQEALVSEVNRLESSLLLQTPPPPRDKVLLQVQPPQSQLSPLSPVSPGPQRRPLSLDMRARSDHGSVFNSPTPSLFRSRFSDLSLSLLRERERERERDDEAEAELLAEREKMRKMGMTIAQANKIIAESTKLNEELSQMVDNLKSRQEESDHIHGLLIERAERAAQRILFLQNRISYLEEELQENDDELQHLRISLKAIEVQMPPHPDKELTRCIANFKEDYQALKRKRVNRNSLASVDSSVMDSLRSDSTSTR